MPHRPRHRRRLHPWPRASLLLLLLACAPKVHTVEPYRSSYEQGIALQRRAAATCESERGERVTPPVKKFITDGCSAWFNRGWVECCVTHDIAYWCGGSAEDRKQADAELERCVEQTRSGFLGTMFYVGVRLGGHPVWPMHYRWGFGKDTYLPLYEDDPSGSR